MKKQHITIAAALVASGFAVAGQPAEATPSLYVSYTDTVTNVADSFGAIGTTGLPGSATNNLAYITNASGGLAPGSSSSPITVSFSGLNTETNATTNGILFNVNPAPCADTACDHGTSTVPEVQTANINFTMYFYSSAAGGTPIGWISDTAYAKFNYKTDQDNLCWQDSLVSGKPGVLGPHSLTNGDPTHHTPQCGLPGAGTPTWGFSWEQTEIDLGGNLYYVDLHDWNDWTETPHISFQLICDVNCVPGPQGFPTPEPITLSLFGAGLGGALAMRRRKKIAA